MDLQERYVASFDRGRARSLYLFEHVHGESRDRGQAMVNLLEIYRRHEFELNARELPDYIPLFMEYLAQRPDGEALDLLADNGGEHGSDLGRGGGHFPGDGSGRVREQSRSSS